MNTPQRLNPLLTAKQFTDMTADCGECSYEDNNKISCYNSIDDCILSAVTCRENNK